MLIEAVRIVAFLGLVTVIASQDDVQLDGTRGLKVHCSRKGARIELYRSASNGTSTGKITIIFAELSEVDMNGKAVSGQSGGKGKHSYTAFDKQDFSIAGPANVVLANSNQVNASCLTVRADLQDMYGPTFAGQVCAVKDNGTLFLGEENSTVSAGQLKFTVNVSKWIWAESGEFLELSINIKIPPGQMIRDENKTGSKGKQPKRFLFGNSGAGANFSTQVKVDDSWKAMPDGYPKYEQRGANNYITIRLPRFANYSEYDPSVEPGNDWTYSKGSFTLLSSIPLGILSLLMASLVHL